MSGDGGYRCAVCGAGTRISETRAVVGGLRRRRVCIVPTCCAKITTLEFEVAEHGTRVTGPMVAISVKDLVTVTTILTAGLPKPNGAP